MYHVPTHPPVRTKNRQNRTGGLARSAYIRHRIKKIFYTVFIDQKSLCCMSTTKKSSRPVSEHET
jgi:hypothetical protein